jgi:hypothetical protein
MALTVAQQAKANAARVEAEAETLMKASFT